MNAAKAKGTRWESAIVAFLAERGWVNAERRALHGTQDKGDVVGIPGVVIEAKSAARLDLAGWLAEAEAERVNDRARWGVVWAKRRGKTSPSDGYVLMSGRTFVELLLAAEGLDAVDGAA